MFLPTKMTNRRQFLGRSALGAGSILLAPLLLESCADHIVPDPTKPTPNPVHVPSTDGGSNWNAAAIAAIITGLGQKPNAGQILGGLATSLWPSSGQDVWDQLRDQVQTLLRFNFSVPNPPKTIPDSVYKDVKTNLASLKAQIDEYLTALATGTQEEINDKWGDVKDGFLESKHYYIVAGYELLLLPFFVQYSNMYLALLADGVAYGKNFGRTDADHQQDIQDLQNYIQGSQQHVTGRYANGKANVVNNTGENCYLAEPFRSVNTYERGMTLLVLDFMNTWPYFDVTQYPNGAVNLDGTPITILTREIYSDPYGSCGNGGPIVIRTYVPTPTQLPTQLTVWGADQIDAVELTYPYPGRVGAVIETGRMGNQTGGTNQPPNGGTFDLSPNNPITQFRVVSQPDPANQSYGPYVFAMQFQRYDGTLTNLLGGASLPPEYETKTHPDGSLVYDVTGLMGYGYNALSSIHVSGLNDRFSTADGIVFGFKYWQPQ